ncbi:unnamed protein product [Miscanthus lutarioriparius]|uniref:UBA domain-containing protein n=1 Tax=Miscanthus lutarioriparius TaxID=422564 RepID=A0A811PIK1_9POAL|nr:unnamed protein product [Miscanthus lutarioriparius]
MAHGRGRRLLLLSPLLLRPWRARARVHCSHNSNALCAPDSAPDPTATSGPTPTVLQFTVSASSYSAPVSAPDPTATSDPASTAASINNIEANPYGQAVSNLVASGNLEATVQSILEMGGGAWDQDTVVRALQAAYNNLERAVEYLYSRVSEQVEFPAALAAPPASGQLVDPVQAPQSAQPAIPSSVPNANTLDPFPQVVEILMFYETIHNSEPLLQELGKQNPQIMQLIQENLAEFLRLINDDPADGALEQMGFDLDLVLEVFFACDKDEHLAANYPLDHMNKFDDEAQQ